MGANVIHIVDDCQPAYHVIVPVQRQSKNVDAVIIQAAKGALRVIFRNGVGYVIRDRPDDGLQLGRDRNQLALQIVNCYPKQVFASAKTLHCPL